ncbi:hypothetical protein GCM10023261_09250 [Bartonella jaculi]|uniref:Uncharacterized protein n=2 Tax=Bartonella jaculi TaxID=686226 RepID=A0ABP9N4D1_9HYPH
MQQAGLGVCPYGFHSSLASWFAEITNTPYEDAEIEDERTAEQVFIIQFL